MSANKSSASSPSMSLLVEALPSTVPFTGPETIERLQNKAFTARLGANENGFGPSPAAKDAMQQAIDSVWKYGDPDNFELRSALAKHHNLHIDNIAAGAGVDALLGLTVRMFLNPGDIVINSLGGYPTFNYHVAGFGGKLVTVPYKNDHSDPEALARAAAEHNAKIVYLANPDNPMGTWHHADVIEKFIQMVPEDTLIILDEAYCDMAPANSIPSFDVTRKNIIRMRTFSKAYGLAGIRCGYAIAHPDIIRSFDKIRDHFAVSIIAQAAATAALHDQEYLAEILEKISQSRNFIYKTALENGLMPITSATNFVTIDCGKDDIYAEKVMNALLQQGIFVRKPMVENLNRCIRVSTGPVPEMELFAKALPAAIAIANGAA